MSRLDRYIGRELLQVRKVVLRHDHHSAIWQRDKHLVISLSSDNSACDLSLDRLPGGRLVGFQESALAVVAVLQGSGPNVLLAISPIDLKNPFFGEPASGNRAGDAN